MIKRFDELCDDFDRRKPTGAPVRRTFLVSTLWPENMSVNDVLISFLKGHGYEYLRDFNGTVWFLFQNEWHSCSMEVSAGNKYISFYMLDYDQGG